MNLGKKIGTGITASFSKCRHEPTLIFTAGDLKVYGASEAKLDKRSAREFDLVVNLLGHRKFRNTESLFSVPRKWGFLKRFTGERPIEEIVIDWKDYGVLPVGRSFWEAFYQKLKQDGYRKVLFFCFGGHGRTGTATGCLMTVALECHGGDAIRKIREGYCREAIETKEQEDYVRSMTKIIKQ